MAKKNTKKSTKAKRLSSKPTTEPGIAKLGLTAVALVALISVVAVVAMVLNVGTSQLSLGAQLTSAEEIGEARCEICLGQGIDPSACEAQCRRPGTSDQDAESNIAGQAWGNSQKCQGKNSYEACLNVCRDKGKVQGSTCDKNCASECPIGYSSGSMGGRYDMSGCGELWYTSWCAQYY